MDITICLDKDVIFKVVELLINAVIVVILILNTYSFWPWTWGLSTGISFLRFRSCNNKYGTVLDSQCLSVSPFVRGFAQKLSVLLDEAVGTYDSGAAWCSEPTLSALFSYWGPLGLASYVNNHEKSFSWEMFIEGCKHEIRNTINTESGWQGCCHHGQIQ